MRIRLKIACLWLVSMSRVLWGKKALGEVTYEQTTRAGEDFALMPVYGVDSKVGLTREPKYSAENQTRYKTIEPGMFAYNPMRLNIGSIGLCRSSYVKGLVSPDYVVFGCDQEVLLPEFLYYAIQGQEWSQWTSVAGVGSVRQRVYYKELARLTLTIPPLAAQRNVVTVLSTLDDKIKLNRQINQTLELIVQTIFKSWFIDLEPVKAKIAAKAEGCDPERAAMCAISGKTDTELSQLPAEQRQQLAATAALFPDELVKSELGGIPKGWSASLIGNEVVAMGGGTPSTQVADYWNGGTFNWATPKDFSGISEKVLLSTERKITEAGLSKISSGLLPTGTVLMSSRAPVGYLALAKIPTAVNQGFIAMRCEKLLSPEFVLQWAHHMMDDIKQRASGTTFAEISKSNFRQIPVVVPTKKVVDSYTEIASNFYELIAGNVAESHRLSETRDSLLPKFLSGEMNIEGEIYG